MTKLGAERRYLLGAVAENTWSDQVTEEALSHKQKIRDGRHARAETDRVEKARHAADHV